MANDATNVSVGKPKVGGAIWCAPISSTLVIPTDATTALDTAFKCLGYCSDAGLVNSRDHNTGNINAWGGDNVLDYGSIASDKFKFTLLETLNIDVLKAVYGEDNVKGDLATGISIDVGSQLPEAYVWVFELVMRNKAVKRIVVPQAAITEVGDVTYTDEDAVGYETTISATPIGGKYHHEYIVRA